MAFRQITLTIRLHECLGVAAAHGMQPHRSHACAVYYFRQPMQHFRQVIRAAKAL